MAERENRDVGIDAVRWTFAVEADRELARDECFRTESRRPRGEDRAEERHDLVVEIRRRQRLTELPTDRRTRELVADGCERTRGRHARKHSRSPHRTCTHAWPEGSTSLQWKRVGQRSPVPHAREQ